MTRPRVRQSWRELRAGRHGSLRPASDRPTPPGRCGNRPLHADGGCWRSARGAVRLRLRARNAIAPTNIPPAPHPAGTRRRAPTAGMVHPSTPPGGQAAACPCAGQYGDTIHRLFERLDYGCHRIAGRLTSRMVGMDTVRSTAAMVKAVTYDPVASNIMPENRGPVAVPMLCAILSAPNTAP